jgi:hypothetical protein
MKDVVVAVAENTLDKAELQRMIEGILKGSIALERNVCHAERSEASREILHYVQDDI